MHAFDTSLSPAVRYPGLTTREAGNLDYFFSSSALFSNSSMFEANAA